MITETLSGLRDVGDVEGSFLLGARGELVARDLPAVFHDEVFGEVGPRLARLRETLESDGDDLSSLTLRFAEHKLHLRSVGALMLGVVTGARVNGPALRMAINLVARRVASLAPGLEPEVTPDLAPEEVQPRRAAGPAATPLGMHRAPGVMGRGDIVFKGNKL